MKSFILIFLFIVFYAGYLVFTKIIFGDNNLITIEGTGPSLIRTRLMTEQGAKVLYLNFRLKESERNYTLAADISGLPDGERTFDGVVLSLKEAGKVNILIRKGDLADFAPKVYQMSADEKQVFSLNRKSNVNADLFLMLLLLILLFCSTYYWLQCLKPHKKTPISKNRWAF